MTIRNRLQTAMLDDQVEQLDAAIKTIAAVTGRGISEIEDAVVNLFVPQLPPGACPYCKGTGKGTWTMGNSHIATHCLYCRGTGKTA